MTATNDQYILGQPLSEGQEEDDCVDDDDEWGKIFLFIKMLYMTI